MSESKSVILYPFGPPVRDRDKESNLNGSIDGIPISVIPENVIKNQINNQID